MNPLGLIFLYIKICKVKNKAKILNFTIAGDSDAWRLSLKGAVKTRTVKFILDEKHGW